MRQIDNMTPQELDTLALKGMTAPRTASERPAPNKAQHSPLRQVTIAEYSTFFALKNGSDTLATSPIREPLDALARAYNHADKLAEALIECRDILCALNTSDGATKLAYMLPNDIPAAIKRGYEAITEWRSQ